jgi:transposase
LSLQVSISEAWTAERSPPLSGAGEERVPYSGAVFVFRARRADRGKLIVSDGTGLCLFAKRLEQAGSAGPRSWAGRYG